MNRNKKAAFNSIFQPVIPGHLSLRPCFPWAEHTTLRHGYCEAISRFTMGVGAFNLPHFQWRT